MLTRLLRGHGALLAAGVLSIAACAGCGVVQTRTTLGPARKLVIAISGPPSALYAPIYEGIANGDFARGALSVSVSVAADQSAALNALSSGRAALAIAPEPAVLAARAAGAQLVAVGALFDGPLQSLISLQSHPVTAPAQLIGKTVATDGSPLAAAELTTFLARAAIPLSRVRTIEAAGDLDAPLITHKAVASIGGLSNYDAVRLALAHERPSVTLLTAAGVPGFSELAVVARVGEARRDGAVLRSFLQSLTRSQQAVRADPRAVAALLATINPSVSDRFEQAILAASKGASQPPAGEPFGFQSPQTWSTFADWMNSHGLLSHATDGGFAVTDEFLPGQGE
jgi:ABC-type nitrate/sulfonate/bicarbonate transport system substrate-binding protein